MQAGVFRACSTSPLDPSPTHTGTVYVDGDGADVAVGIDVAVVVDIGDVVDIVVVVDVVVGDEGASGFASRHGPSRPVLSRGVSLSSRARGRCDGKQLFVRENVEIQCAPTALCGGFLSFMHAFSASSVKKSCFLRLSYTKEAAICHPPL